MTQLETPVQTPHACRKRVRSGTPPPSVGVEDENTAVNSDSDNDSDSDDEEEEEPTANELSEVAPPLWKRNAKFLLAYLLRRDDPRAATHSSLVGGRYFIPPDMRQAFYHKYYTEMLSARSPSLFLTERYNEEPFRFFVDMDFDFKDDHVPNHVDVIAQLRRALAVRWDEYFKFGVGTPTIELFPCRAARRTAWKLHVIFWKLIVDWRSALKMGQLIQKKLEEAGCRYVLDPLVYTKGSLRMVGSFKKNEVTPSHERETEFIYTPIDIISGEALDVTEATIEEFSIFLPANQLRYLDEAPDVMAEDGSLDFRSGRDAASSSADLQYKGIGNVAQDSPLYKCIEDHYGEKMARGADKIIQVGKCITVTMLSTFCPLVGREHGGNHSYIIISSKGMRVGCHSKKPENVACQKGGDRIPFKDLPGEVVGMIPEEVFYPDPAQNAAFIRSFSGTDRDVAEYASFALRGNFVAANTKNNESTWWFFTNGRWNNAAAGKLLYDALNRLPLVYEEIAEQTEDEKERKILTNIAMKISDLTFLNKLTTRMCRHLLDTSLEKKLDSKRHLLGFNDGVYDFLQMKFRPAAQTDYISMSVGYNFPKESNPIYREKLDKFYTDIQPEPVQRLYVQKVLASALNTTNPREEFYVFSGNTRNGKSGLCDLMSCTLGSDDMTMDNDSKYSYASIYNPAFLTKERKGSDAPSPDLLDFRLSRAMFGNEPANDAKIQTNTMKAFTGRDTWSARFLNENKMWKFKIYAALFMNCNDRPLMSSNEPAVWQRVRVVDFPNKFVPNPTLPHERPEDLHIKTEMVDDLGWRREHMLMLLEVYKDELLPNGLQPPESVIAATREYCEESNPLIQWWQDNTEEAATHVSTADLRDNFRFSENGIRDISAKAFTKRLRLELGVNINSSVRCVGKENPTTGVENRRLKGTEENIAPVI